MKTYVADPSGYCQGVKRAIALAMNFKKAHPSEDVYVLGTIVHNEIVTEELRTLGIYSLTSFDTNEAKINHLPDGACLIFSAHGHDDKLEQICQKKKITWLDATCPIVALSKENILKALKDKHEVIYVGMRNHPETVAMLSLSTRVHLYDDIKDDLAQIKDNKPFVTNQTTLSCLELEETFNKIKTAFPHARFQNEICHETKLRQEAIKKMPSDVDCVFVVGGKDSSNTARLYELAKKHFSTLKIYRILNESEINAKNLKGLLSAAVISGASTPIDETMKIKVKLDGIW